MLTCRPNQHDGHPLRRDNKKPPTATLEIPSSNDRQGLADGFLAPYRVHRIVTSTDAAAGVDQEANSTSWARDSDEEYHTSTLASRFVLLEAIAKHLTNFLQRTSHSTRPSFLFDQEHRREMRQLLNNLVSASPEAPGLCLPRDLRRKPSAKATSVVFRTKPNARHSHHFAAPKHRRGRPWLKMSCLSASSAP